MVVIDWRRVRGGGDRSGGDVGTDHDVDVGPVVPRRSWLILVAVVVLLVAAAVMVNRDHGGSGLMTTTVPASPASGVSMPTIGREPSPTFRPLEQPTGLLVYVAVRAPDGEVLSSVDLDRRRVRRVTATESGAVSLVSAPVLGDAVVVPTPDGLVAAHPDGARQDLGRNRDIGGSVAAFDAGRPDAFWRVTLERDRVRTRLELVTADGGAVEQTFDVPVGYGVYAGDGVGGLLIASPERHVWRLPPGGGDLVRLDVALPMAVSGGRLATVRCDDRFVCAVEIVDLGSGNRRLIPGALQPGRVASLSPDGSRLAQVHDTVGASGPASVLAVVDTVTGAELMRQPYPPLADGPPRWSPQGRWLVWGDGGGLEVWDAAGTGPRRVELPTIDDALMTVVGVVAAPG